MAEIKERNGRRAVDLFTRDIKEWHEKRGVNISSEQARKQALELAHRAEQKIEKKK